MPFYEYKCSNCGHELEELQSMKEAPLEKCPVCGKNTLQKLMGTGAGLIFKGSGFYLTDYKKKSSSASNGSGKESEKTEKKESKSESISESKKDSKTGAKDDSGSSSKSGNASGESKGSSVKKENKKS
jgi:putative FmdB family regulatory protein